MAGRIKCGVSSSIEGAAMVALGLFLLHENFNSTVATVNHALCANGCQTLGMLPAAVLAIAQVLREYAANRSQFLYCVLHHMMVSCWPLLLVLTGGVKSRDASTNDDHELAKEDYALVDLTADRSTLE